MKRQQINTRKVKTADKTCVIRIRIDANIKKKLQKIAKNEHRSLARQVGWCCERWMEAAPPFTKAEREAVKTLATSKTEIVSDLSALGLVYAESPEGRLERGLTISHDEMIATHKTDAQIRLAGVEFEKNGIKELRYYDPKTWKGEY